MVLQSVELQSMVCTLQNLILMCTLKMCTLHNLIYVVSLSQKFSGIKAELLTVSKDELQSPMKMPFVVHTHAHTHTQNAICGAHLHCLPLNFKQNQVGSEGIV